MKIEIESEDRIGISHEVLAKLNELALNINAMEVITGAIYLNITAENRLFNDIRQALVKVSGVVDCRLIEWLPTESREQHLQALLKRIPDPIFDINQYGEIISCNYQSHIYRNKFIEKVLNVPFERLKSMQPFSYEVNFEDNAYHAEITPLWQQGSYSGSVIILKSLNRLAQHVAMFRSGNEGSGLNDIIGHSAHITALKQQIIKFSSLDLPTLITGETGTGKELVARAIHQQSSRNSGPFLAINCAALPEQLLESELFGYVAGAFTGANAQGKPGLLELANGGTVFLDEVAEMSVYLQAKLLRFLQDYSFRRLGGTRELNANVRIISASHQNFDELVKAKHFREDLYYRLNVLNLAILPLKARQDDTAELSQFFIVQAAQQVNLPTPVLAKDAINYLLTYSWPGNVRQLQSVMFRLVALSNGHTINQVDVKSVLDDFATGTYEPMDMPLKGGIANIANWQAAQEHFERELLTELYPQYPTTRKLAERLGVSHNKIAMKLRKYGIA
ncbi:sigma 54-interacting transcriptional regulator [Colwellia sp. MEBiC06753]